MSVSFVFVGLLSCLSARPTAPNAGNVLTYLTYNSDVPSSDCVSVRHWLKSRVRTNANCKFDDKECLDEFCSFIYQEENYVIFSGSSETFSDAKCCTPDSTIRIEPEHLIPLDLPSDVLTVSDPCVSTSVVRDYCPSNDSRCMNSLCTELYGDMGFNRFVSGDSDACCVAEFDQKNFIVEAL